MSRDSDGSRRRFLALVGATATALAGCSDSPAADETGTDDPSRTTGSTPRTTEAIDTPPASETATTATPTETVDETPTATPGEQRDGDAAFEHYPYGIGESRVDAARAVMEAAGYGPDDRFELGWHAASGLLLLDVGREVKQHLSDAHIEVTTTEHKVTVDPELKADGSIDAFPGLYIADYPSPRDVVPRVFPPNTNYRDDGSDGPGPFSDGAALFWTPESDHGPGRTAAIGAVERLRNNPAPTEDARATRNDAVRQTEQAIWADVPLVPVAHDTHAVLWHDRVDYRPPGPMGREYASTARSVRALDGADRLDLVTEPIDTLDPVAAPFVQQSAITDVFETPFAYPNGAVDPERLLVDRVDRSDDGTTYTFHLTDGVQFHDGTDLTAADVVYSWRRVAESPHSLSREFLTELLGVEHRTDDEGSVAPDSLGIEATGERAVELRLEAPFVAVPEVLALSPFSVVPEGIVGDVEGYEGRMDYETFRTSPVGCGPFAVDGWTRGERLSLARFDDYHGDHPAVDGVDRTVEAGTDEVLARFPTGNVDVIEPSFRAEAFDLSAVEVDRTDARGRAVGTYTLPAGQTVAFARIPALRTQFLSFNCERVPLAVRRAVAYVLDQSTIVDREYYGPMLPAYHLTPPPIFPGGYQGYRTHYRGAEG